MRTNRIAVSAFFFFNGFMYANWTSRMPEIQSFYGINNGQLGTLLFTIALGSIIAMPFSGWLTTKFGSWRVTQIAGITSTFILPMIVLTNQYYLIIPLFISMGFAFGSTDVAMNGQAVYVERLFGRPLMSSFHAVFSVGMAFGASAGFLFSYLGINLFHHLLTIAIIAFVSLVYASSYLINDKPDEGAVQSKPDFVFPTKAILPLALIGFCGMVGEGSLTDWSAVFMHKVVGQTESFSTLAFLSYAFAMMLGRTQGDKLIGIHGKRKLMVYGSVISITGLIIALSFATVSTTLIGFFLVGIGLSNIVPIVYSTAGNTEGVSPSIGIAMATTVGYMGFFVGPPAIGYLSDTFGLKIGLCFTLTLFIIMLILIRKFISVSH